MTAEEIHTAISLFLNSGSHLTVSFYASQSFSLYAVFPSNSSLLYSSSFEPSPVSYLYYKDIHINLVQLFTSLYCFIAVLESLSSLIDFSSFYFLRLTLLLLACLLKHPSLCLAQPDFPLQLQGGMYYISFLAHIFNYACIKNDSPLPPPSLSSDAIFLVPSFPVFLPLFCDILILPCCQSPTLFSCLVVSSSSTTALAG